MGGKATLLSGGVTLATKDEVKQQRRRVGPQAMGGEDEVGDEDGGLPLV